MNKLFLSCLATVSLLSFSSCDSMDDDNDHRHPTTTTTTTEETTRSVPSLYAPYTTSPRSTTVETQTTRSSY